MGPAPLAAREPLAGLIETSRSGTNGVGLAAAWRALAAVLAALPPVALAPPPCVAATMPALPQATAITAPQAQAAVVRDMLRTVIPPVHGAL